VLDNLACLKEARQRYPGADPDFVDEIKAISLEAMVKRYDTGELDPKVR
jgi:hypothetical protein